jgi:hypothetical protein
MRPLYRTALMLAAGLSVLCAACGAPENNPPGEPSVEALNKARERPVDETAVTRTLESQGFRSFHLGEGNRFSIAEASAREMFDRACTERTSPTCDAFENYRTDVVIEDWANVTFYHRDGMRTAYVTSIVCTNEAPGWDCASGAQQ